VFGEEMGKKSDELLWEKSRVINSYKIATKKFEEIKLLFRGFEKERNFNV